MVGMIESLIQDGRGSTGRFRDYSTLCQRQARIAVQVPYRTSGQPLDLLVDSTGIKFRGDGAWQARKHGPSRRRQWRKVHIAMDAGTGDVRAVEFTSSRQGDSPSLPDLLAQIPPEEAIGRSPQTVPMIHDDAMARSLTETPKRPYRSVAMVALGRKLSRCCRAKQDPAGNPALGPDALEDVDRPSRPKSGRGFDELPEALRREDHVRTPRIARPPKSRSASPS